MKNSALQPHAIAIAGRVMVAMLFIVNGFGLIQGFAQVSAQLLTKGLPYPEAIVLGTIAFQIGGGLLLFMGWRLTWIALAYFVWLIPATIVFHAPWSAEPSNFVDQMIHFLKNVGLMGAMLLIVADGIELDKAKASKKI